MKMQFTNPELLKEITGKLFDAVPASLVVLDRRGKILAINKAFTSFTNKDPKDMIGRSLLEMREIKDPALNKKYLNLFKKGTPFYGHVFRHFAEQQNRWYTMILSAVPLKDGSGKILGAVSIAKDITELAETKKELHKLNQRLQKKVDLTSLRLSDSERSLKKALVSRNQFFADASHELRTPLTIIKGNLDLIKLKNRENHLPEEIKKIYDILSLEIDRLAELLTAITFLNQIDNGSLKFRESYTAVDLKALLLETVEGLKSLAENKKIRLIFAGSQAMVWGDELKLKRLAENLIGNALRYVSGKGSVRIGLKTAGKSAVFTVEDNGIGIAREHLPHIFERFYRADKVRSRAFGGSGLGLAIVKEIVAQHNGTIKVNSALGKGTKFTVRLPAIKKS